MSARTMPVLLVTQPARAVSNTRRAPGTILYYAMVVAVRVGDWPLVRFTPPDYDRWVINGAPEKEQPVRQLPIRMAKRLSDFVDYAFVKKGGDFGGFELVDYLMGYTSSPGEFSPRGYVTHTLGSAGPSPLHPTVLVDGRTSVTARIGWGRGVTLGVNGKNSALGIAPNDQLMKACGATAMLSIGGLQ